LSTARAYLAGMGTQTAALAAGGSGFLNTTEEYNGSGWSNGGDLNTARTSASGAGTQTAGLAFGGTTAPPGPANITGATEEYDGSSWTAGGSMNTSTQQFAGAGTQTAGLAFGGYIGTNIANTEEYNGASWTAGGNLNTAVRGHAGAGIQTAGLSFGGFSTTFTNATEEYNGSSWTSVSSMNTARATAGAGIQDAALAFGGSTPPFSALTEKYDGTSWTTSPATLATARQNLRGAGTQPAALAMGGETTVNLANTEEYNVSTNTITAAAWASGPSINTGRITKNGGLGPTSASLIFGGNPGTAPYTTNATEEYDGSSWTTGGTYPVASSEISGAAGTQTDALGFAQSDSPTALVANYNGTSWSVNPATFPTGSGGTGTGESSSAIYAGYSGTNSLEWDNTSWTAGGTMNTSRTGQGTGFGNASSAIQATGRTSPSTLTNDTEEYNGTSWTSVGNVNTARKRLAASRAFSNASGYIFGGTPATNNAGPTFTDTEFWNGTNWSTAPNLSTGTGNQFGAGTTDAFSIGGQPNPPISSATEIFNPETTTQVAKTLSSS